MLCVLCIVYCGVCICGVYCVWRIACNVLRYVMCDVYCVSYIALCMVYLVKGMYSVLCIVCYLLYMVHFVCCPLCNVCPVHCV